MHVAYLAGLLDGEGSILLRAQGKGRCRAPEISIGMVDEAPIRAVAGTWGGFVSEKVRSGGRKTMYVWRLQGWKSLDLLNELHPFLVIERRRALAELLANDPVLRSDRKGPGTSKVAHAEALFQKMRALNAIRQAPQQNMATKRPQEPDYHYLAGVLDGEGYISFARRTVEVTSTDPELPEWIAARFGGGLYPRRGRGNCRDQVLWARSPTGCTWAARVADLMLLDRKAEELRQMQGFKRTPPPAPVYDETEYEHLRRAGVRMTVAAREGDIPLSRARAIEALRCRHGTTPPTTNQRISR